MGTNIEKLMLIKLIHFCMVKVIVGGFTCDKPNTVRSPLVRDRAAPPPPPPLLLNHLDATCAIDTYQMNHSLVHTYIYNHVQCSDTLRTLNQHVKWITRRGWPPHPYWTCTFNSASARKLGWARIHRWHLMERGQGPPRPRRTTCYTRTFKV